MFGIGMMELMVILLVCLLIFGAEKLPGIGKAFGRTVSEFKRAMKDEDAAEKK